MLLFTKTPKNSVELMLLDQLNPNCFPKIGDVPQSAGNFKRNAVFWAFQGVHGKKRKRQQARNEKLKSYAGSSLDTSENNYIVEGIVLVFTNFIRCPVNIPTHHRQSRKTRLTSLSPWLH